MLLLEGVADFLLLDFRVLCPENTCSVWNIFEAEGQSLHFLDDRISTVGSFLSLVFFLQTDRIVS